MTVCRQCFHEFLTDDDDGFCSDECMERYDEEMTAVPVKNTEWRQPDPFMQMTAIRSALEGWFQILEDEVVSKQKFLRHVRTLLKTLRSLEPFLKNPTLWNQS
jgi:hypothetical protein